MEVELSTALRDKERLDKKLTEVMVELGVAETMRDDWGSYTQQLIDTNTSLYQQLESLQAENEQLKAQIQLLDTPAIAPPYPEIEELGGEGAAAPSIKLEIAQNIDTAEAVEEAIASTNELLPDENINIEVAIADDTQPPIDDVEPVTKTTYTASELLKAKKQLIQKEFGNKINDQKLRDWHRSALRGYSGKVNLAKLNVEALPRLDDDKILFADL